MASFGRSTGQHKPIGPALNEPDLVVTADGCGHVVLPSAEVPHQPGDVFASADGRQLDNCSSVASSVARMISRLRPRAVPTMTWLTVICSPSIIVRPPSAPVSDPEGLQRRLSLHGGQPSSTSCPDDLDSPDLTSPARLKGTFIVTDVSTFAELLALDHGLCVVSTLRRDGSIQASVVNGVFLTR